MKTEVRDFLVGVLRDVLHLEIDDDHSDETPLDLESLFLVELVVQAEGRFGIELADEEVYQDSTVSLGDLVRLVVDKRTAVELGSGVAT
ncbi:acyl carrier protein [Actinoalloteichus hymeniacidonis]|uniref:Acyl carrier protein n=1 Tax=Actinoalloteichus hymeniacidonis TaxID=340345 RepID=A0AAC9HPG2_9PSEU|nr:acyl carrier protein [Actinoalloteichus hymeniacidonis]AOS62165.1 acyl carrier protein [Actinoalloteichus hymeniacidonis]MBB5909812.1 acyl carrier protein [Actinoalloteichus hymeniacidonis]